MLPDPSRTNRELGKFLIDLSFTRSPLARQSPARIPLRPRYILRTPHIPQIIFIRAKPKNIFSLRRQPQVSRNDRERAIFRHHRQEPRRNHVHTRKTQRLRLLTTSNQLRNSVASRPPSGKLHVLVEQQIPRSLPLLHRQGSQGLMLVVE